MESAERARSVKVARVGEDTDEGVDEKRESEAKQDRVQQESNSTLLSTGSDIMSPDRESSSGSDSSDEGFYPDSLPLNADEKMDEFCDNWIRSLDRDHRVSLGLFSLF